MESSTKQNKHDEKSGRLREFQVQLLERMNAARNGYVMHENRLGIVVCGRRCLLDLHEAEEIVHPMPITPVPLTKDWYLGLANVRGNLISVIDLDCFCGAQAQVLSKDRRVIILPAALSVNCGLLVSSVLGLRRLQEMMLQDQRKSAPSWLFGQDYIDRDMREWSEVSFAAIVDDARFLHVAL